MKKYFLMLVLTVFAFVRSYALSNNKLRVVMDKPVASVGDAMTVVSDMPGASPVKGLKAEQSLTVGDLAVVLIKAGVLKGGVFYSVSGWNRYAAESLLWRGLIPRAWSWNRRLSGVEMLGVISRLLPSSEKSE